jgi:hypothetical protein
MQLSYLICATLSNENFMILSRLPSVETHSNGNVQVTVVKSPYSFGPAFKSKPQHHPHSTDGVFGETIGKLIE